MTTGFYDPFVSLTGWEWLANINFGSIIIRLILAILCGGVLGYERAKKHQAAGFRTYILVCLGATIATMTNDFVFKTTGSGDAARLGAQVISGIGFLGAGTILVTSRNQIRGLTTAAGLWACACLGLSIGFGFYTLAVFGVLLIVVVLAILPILEKSILSKTKNIEIHIEFDCRQNLKDFITYVRANGFRVVSTDHNQAYSASGLSVYTMTLKCESDEKRFDHQAFIKTISEFEYVNYVEEIK